MIICGIDEAGRGPLAGPLVVAGVILNNDIDNLNDSKKITPKKREELFEKIKKSSKYKIVIIENQEIDSFGLSACINKALKEIISSLKAHKYIFDGNSKFGVEKVEPIIKADSKIKEVMAASILAKVTRDKIMCDLEKKYPNFKFCKHKGYGTKEHIDEIKKYGLTSVHRKSFKPKSLQPTLF
ncbi:ribonuclease HII [Nitrosophilus kaiyonis]|uniref:ribonuclease HII n=1 Tax=Nitrosophilus kaiyonis TaxID=2930200 RepID=UPI002491379E|nr:ribonuclease HII [Nitrosophilus kaiyonis]